MVFGRNGISRRTVLRGVLAGGISVAVPLPRLGAMLNSNGTAYADGWDPKAVSIADQYMFGNALLLKPVSDVGAASRSVYLPANTTWYDFWSGSSARGGQTIGEPTPIEHLPLYVRGGSIVPLGPVEQHASEKLADPIELRVYRGADGAFTLHDDENDKCERKKGTHATIPLT